MEIRQKIETEVRIGFKCDICGALVCDHTNKGGEKICPINNGGSSCNFHMTLHGDFGYGSNKDMEEHLCHMCEKCYDKVRQFIEIDLGGKIQIAEHCFDHVTEITYTTLEDLEDKPCS